MNPNESHHPLLTRREIAQRTRVTTRTVTRWVAAGLLSEIRIGGVVRFSAAELEEVLTSRKKKPAGRRASMKATRVGRADAEE